MKMTFHCETCGKEIELEVEFSTIIDSQTQRSIEPPFCSEKCYNEYLESDEEPSLNI